MIYGKNIHPRCEYCVESRPVYGGQQVICRRRGVVELNYSCRRFAYDPLKRRPRRRPPLGEYAPGSFSLD